MAHRYLVLSCFMGLFVSTACGNGKPSASGGGESTSETGECSRPPCVPAETGDGDGDGGSSDGGSGDGDSGDGDGDGDGDSGDGDGDGDGDSGDGDGDGDMIPPNCGDAVIDPGEQCDDGNTLDHDGCSMACQVEVGPACGDGALQAGNGEECDDGNTLDTDGCSANCQLERVGESCGDGIVDPREVCDDGNTDNGDGCNPTCNLANTTSFFAGTVGVTGLVDGIGPNARFGSTTNLAIDNTYVYVSDAANHAIRRVDIASASVVTIVGNGMKGDFDSPTGIDAQLDSVGAITTDGTTLWVADTGNRKLKAVSLTPPFPILTVAGNGMQAVVDGTGSQVSFNDLRGLCYYDGYVYLLDGVGAVLRRFDPQTNQVVTIAGHLDHPGVTDGVGLEAQFVSPRYMTSDNSGMLYIADTNGYHIRSYNVATNFVGTFAGSDMAGYVDAVGTNASIHRPRGMASDGTSIYFVEFDQHTIRQGVIETAWITTNVGQHCDGGMVCNGGYMEGVGTAAQLDEPFDVKFHYPSNSLFFFDGNNHVLRRIQ